MTTSPPPASSGLVLDGQTVPSPDDLAARLRDLERTDPGRADVGWRLGPSDPAAVARTASLLTDLGADLASMALVSSWNLPYNADDAATWLASDRPDRPHPWYKTLGAAALLAWTQPDKIDDRWLADLVGAATDYGVLATVLCRCIAADPTGRGLPLLEVARDAGLRWSTSDVVRIGYSYGPGSPEVASAARSRLDVALRPAFDLGVRYGLPMAPESPWNTPDQVADWLATAEHATAGQEYTPAWELLPTDPSVRRTLADGLLTLLQRPSARDRARALAAFRHLPHPSLAAAAPALMRRAGWSQEDPEVGGSLGHSLVVAIAAEPLFLDEDVARQLLSFSLEFGGTEALVMALVVADPAGRGLGAWRASVAAGIPPSPPILGACADTFARHAPASLIEAAGVIVNLPVPSRVAFLEGARWVAPYRLDEIAAALRLKRAPARP
jgi:hypothetical protein